MREGGKRLLVLPPGPLQRQGTKSLVWMVGMLDALEDSGGMNRQGVGACFVEQEGSGSCGKFISVCILLFSPRDRGGWVCSWGLRARRVYGWNCYR